MSDTIRVFHGPQHPGVAGNMSVEIGIAIGIDLEMPAADSDPDFGFAGAELCCNTRL